MEEEDNTIVKWAQEDVETSYNLLNKIKLFVTRHFAVDLCYLNVLRPTTLRNQPFVFKK